MQFLDILTVFTLTRSLICGVEPEDQVDREPGMPAKHQEVQRISCRVMACAVVCVCHCIQMLMPPGLQVRFQCPNHVHKGAVKPLRGSVALGMVGGCVGLDDASTLTQLLHNGTFKIAPLVCMQFCRKPKPAEEISPQHSGNGVGLLVFSGVCLRVA